MTATIATMAKPKKKAADAAAASAPAAGSSAADESTEVWVSPGKG
jgi:hypothetical protein